MKGRTMRKRWLSVLAVLAFCVAFLALTPMAAQAKTIKVKKCGFQTSTAAANKKAGTITRGSHKIVMKGDSGFLKFKAPATKKYTFTYSKLTEKSATGYAYIMEQYGSVGEYITMKTVSTKGGKSRAIWLCNASYWRRLGSSKISTSTSIPKRSAKVKLQKGQTYYLYFSFRKGSTLNLKIK